MPRRLRRWLRMLGAFTAFFFLMPINPSMAIEVVRPAQRDTE